MSRIRYDTPFWCPDRGETTVGACVEALLDAERFRKAAGGACRDCKTGQQVRQHWANDTDLPVALQALPEGPR